MQPRPLPIRLCRICPPEPMLHQHLDRCSATRLLRRRSENAVWPLARVLSVTGDEGLPLVVCDCGRASRGRRGGRSLVVVGPLYQLGEALGLQKEIESGPPSPVIIAPQECRSRCPLQGLTPAIDAVALPQPRSDRGSSLRRDLADLRPAGIDRHGVEDRHCPLDSVIVRRFFGRGNRGREQLSVKTHYLFLLVSGLRQTRGGSFQLGRLVSAFRQLLFWRCGKMKAAGGIIACHLVTKFDETSC